MIPCQVHTIAVVDDEKNIRNLISLALREEALMFQNTRTALPPGSLFKRICRM